MSAEDLGTRELGQVRSQRLDEVSFCPISVHSHTTITALFSDVLNVSSFKSHKDIHTSPEKQETFSEYYVILSSALPNPVPF